MSPHFSLLPTSVTEESLSPGPVQHLADPPNKRDLGCKLKVLRVQLASLQPKAGHCKVEVSREEIFEVLQGLVWSHL